MNVVVLLRRLRAKPDGTPAERLLGRCEEAALAAALGLGDRAKVNVTVLGAGTEREDEALRFALSCGAARALRVAGLDGSDYLGVARALSAAVKHVGFDLVLAGDRSEDERQGAVGPAAAELLGVPHISGAIDVRLDGGAVVVTGRSSSALVHVRVPFPGVVTVASTGHTLSSGGGADGAIGELTLEELGLQAGELRHRDRCLGKAHAVRAVQSATVVAGGGELVARLRADRLL